MAVTSDQSVTMTDTDDYGDWQNPDGTYGESQQPDTLYAAKGPKGGKAGTKPSKPKLKTPKNGEVTILASFVWQPPIDGATEIQYLLDGKWHPGFDDYVEITGVKTKDAPGNLIALLGIITEYKQNSIKRLNFFTHANKTWVGIEGFMDRSNVYFRSSVDESEIAGHASAGMSFTYKKQNFTLDDVRSRFAEDAIFVLYGCDIAFDPTTLLTAWKDLFQATTIGFKRKTVFCPPTQTVGGKQFNRKGETIGVMKPNFKCGVDSTRDWRSLISDPGAVKVAK
jgi:hypothetical protein